MCSGVTKQRLLAQTEVSQDHVPIGVQHDVLRFEISEIKQKLVYICTHWL